MGVFTRPRTIALVSTLVVVAILFLGFIGYHFHTEAKLPLSDALSNSNQKCVGKEEDCNIRLDPFVIPVHYDLFVFPDIEGGNFSGEVKIDITVLNDVDHIRLHIKHLTINHTGLRYNGAELSVVGRENEHLQFWIVKDSNGKNFKKGRYELKIKFHGSLTRDLVGLYRSSYRDPKTNVTKYVVTSKFQSTYARRAFPCFDEPGIKSTFTVTLVKPSDIMALSNMPVEEEIRGRPSEGFTTVRFQKSVKMVTYLVAFAMGEFKYRENRTKRNVPVRIYSTPLQFNHTEYASSIVASIVDFYEDYFGIPYPLPKLDVIGIPDFVSGAMEHWGMISFRESNLVFQSGVGSAKNKQRVTSVIAHELAHMWFGNLMTLKWWNDLWLNEGFASYIEYKGVNHVHPDWDILEQFVPDDLQSILGPDAQHSSHPIVQEVSNPNQITELFDRISYAKGASIIRMLENFMGPESFRRGISKFLQKFSFSNAITEDLWQELQAELGTNESYNITLVMDTWTRQMGFPLITLEKNSTSWTVKQERFLQNSKSPISQPEVATPYDYRWEVPISLSWTDRNGNTNMDLVWMRHFQKNLTLDMDRDIKFAKLNQGQFGFYRVKYTDEMYKNIRLNKGSGWTPAERCGLLDDIFALSAANYLDYGVTFDTALLLTTEEHYIPWECVNHHILSVGQLLRDSNPETYALYGKYVISLIRNMYNKLSWTDSDSDKHLDRLLKPLIFALACASNHTPCLEKTKSIFNNWLDNPNAYRVPPVIRDVVYKYGISQSKTDKWDALLNIYKHESDPQEELRLLRALCHSPEATVISKFLELAKNETLVRRQHYTAVLKFCSSTVVGNPVVWDFYRNQYDYLVKRFTINDRYFGRVIGDIVQYFSSKEKLGEFEDFLSKHPEGGAGTRSRQMALETVQDSIEWVERNQPIILKWLKKQNF